MKYCVYVLISNCKNKTISYVGYTKNIKNRLSLHNISRGAKYTRGRKWIVFHKEIFTNKSKAMSFEYSLKKNRKERLVILNSNKIIKKYSE